MKKESDKISIGNIIGMIIVMFLFIGLGLYIRSIQTDLPTNCYADFRNETLLASMNFSINPDAGHPQQCMNHWNYNKGLWLADDGYETCLKENVSEHQINFMQYCNDFGPTYFLLLAQVIFLFAMPFVTLCLLFAPQLSKLENLFKREHKELTIEQLRNKIKRQKIYLYLRCAYLIGMMILFLVFIGMGLYALIGSWEEVHSDWRMMLEFAVEFGICVMFIFLMIIIGIDEPDNLRKLNKELKELK